MSVLCPKTRCPRDDWREFEWLVGRVAKTAPACADLLTTSVADARKRISAQIQAGKNLAAQQLPHEEFTLLPTTGRDITALSCLEFSVMERLQGRSTTSASSPDRCSSWVLGPEDVASALQGRIRALESILERLELFANPTIESSATAADPAGRALRAYQGLDLHRDIERAASDLYRDGHYANAIEDTVMALNGLVRMRYFVFPNHHQSP